MTNHNVEGVLLIIVSYNPKMEELQKLLSVLSDQGDICLVDNGSMNSSLIESRLSHLLRFSFFSEKNIGLAAALNKGIGLAIDGGYEAVILFDQDSVPTNDFVAKMHGQYVEVSDRSPTNSCAALGPRLMDPESGKLTPFKQFTWPWFLSDQVKKDFSNVYCCDFLITSGCYIPTSVFEIVGLMKEDYFIDNVDLEWCFRAKSFGYSILGCDAAVLYHAIGEHQKNALSKKLGIKKHKPYRSYYTTKNRLDLYKKKYAPTAWKFRDSIRFILKTLMLITINRDRALYFRYIMLAIRNKPIDD